MTAVLVVALLGAVAVLAPGHGVVRASQDAGATYCAGPAEMAMLALINDFRAGHGLDPLGLSEPLGAAATAKSEAMASEEYFSHISPGGETPRELLAEHGYLHNTVTGENIAAGQESAEATFAQWRDSPSHRELLLDEAFEAIGIARAYNVETPYDWYWTAEFGGVFSDPATACAAPAETPPAAPATPPATGTPVHLICEGTRLADGTYDLTCREA
jgi:hypothetical protein